jgi:hypothetical protein
MTRSRSAVPSRPVRVVTACAPAAARQARKTLARYPQPYANRIPEPWGKAVERVERRRQRERAPDERHAPREAPPVPCAQAERGECERRRAEPRELRVDEPGRRGDGEALAPHGKLPGEGVARAPADGIDDGQELDAGDRRAEQHTRPGQQQPPRQRATSADQRGEPEEHRRVEPEVRVAREPLRRHGDREPPRPGPSAVFLGALAADEQHGEPRDAGEEAGMVHAETVLTSETAGDRDDGRTRGGGTRDAVPPEVRHQSGGEQEDVERREDLQRAPLRDQRPHQEHRRVQRHALAPGEQGEPAQRPGVPERETTLPQDGARRLGVLREEGRVEVAARDAVPDSAVRDEHADDDGRRHRTDRDVAEEPA